eukprot:6457235-Amphidinium_carterae.1
MSGPFGGGANQASVEQAFAELASSTECGGQLFQLHYTAIASVLHPCGAVGSDEHYRETWAKVCASRCLQRRGERTKKSRWFALLSITEKRFHEVPVLAMVLEYMAVQKKWVDRSADLPSFQRHCLEDVLVTASQEKKKNSTDKEKNPSCADSWKMLRATHKSQLLLGCRLANCSELQHLVQMMVRVLGPLKRFHGQLVQQLRTQSGAKNFYMNMASGGWQREVLDIWDSLESVESLKSMGLTLPDEVFLTDSDWSQEEKLCQTCVNLVTDTIGHHIVYGLGYAVSYPFKFALLLSDVEATRRATLASVRKDWEMLLEVEKKMPESRVLQQRWKELMWPSLQFVRFIFTSLEEHMFEEVPAHVFTMLESGFTGLASTQPIEDQHHYLRQLEAQSPQRQVSRAMRFVSCIEGQSLDHFECPTVSGLSGGHMQAQSTASAVFAAQGGRPELDCRSLLSTSETTWHSPGPKQAGDVPLIWKSVQQTESNAAELDRTWLSMLLQPGTLIRKESTGQGGLVAYSSMHGAIVLRMQRVGEGANSFFSIDRSSPWRYVVLSDLAGWTVKEVCCVPPGKVRFRPDGAAPLPNTRIVLTLKPGSRMSILEAAARKGFARVSIHWLKVLLNTVLNLQVSPKPKTVDEHLQVLVRHVLPSISDEELQKLLRKGKLTLPADTVPEVPGPSNELSDTTFAELLDPTSDDEDDLLGEVWQEIQAEVTTRMKRASDKPAATPSDSKASGAASSTEKRLALPLLQREDPFTLDELRPLFPPGTTLQHEERPQYRRYRVVYKHGKVVEKTSKAYGKAYTEWSAVVWLLHWTWEHSRVLAGHSCPYSLPDLLSA